MPLDEKANVQAQSSPELTFIQFQCPFCGTDNVKAKENLSTVVLCSQTYCRRFIVIGEVKDIKGAA